MLLRALPPILLLLTLPAHADPVSTDLTIPLYSGYDDASPGKISFVNRAECVNTLKPIVKPEAVISAGLMALGNGFGPASPLSCFDEFFPKWDELMRNPTLVKAAQAGMEKDAPEYEAMKKKYTELDKKVDCVPLHPEGTKEYIAWAKGLTDYCGGKFTDPAQKPDLAAQLKSIKLEISEYNVAKQFDRDLPYNLKQVFFPYLELDPALADVRKKMECGPDATKLPAHCGDTRLSMAEYAALNASEIKLSKEASSKKFAMIEQGNSMAELLRNEEALAQLTNVDKLKEKYRQLKCLGDEGDDGPSESNKRYCLKRGYQISGDRPSLLNEIRAMIPDAPSAVAKWKAEAPQREEAAKKTKQLLKEDNELNYGMRRLLSLYRWHSRHYPGKADELEKFCEAFEKMQLADAEYFRKAKKIDPARSSADWAWMEKYGVTESGLTAIRLYTGSDYGTINTGIWKSHSKTNFVPLSERLQTIRKQLNETLDRAPAYRDSPVRRFANSLPEEILAAHQEGSIVNYDAFTSTSKKEGWSWGGGTAGNAHGFLIYSASGVDVDEVSANKGEGEVLFKAGTRFKVLSRKKRYPEKEIYDFVMAEVDEDGQLLVSLPAGASPGVAP